MSGPAIVVAAAVVLDERGAMLVVRKRGTSSFMQPGGKIEPGESALAALERELREEVGTGFVAGTAEPLGRHAAPAAHEPGRRVEADLYLVTLAEPPRHAAEIEAIAWIDPWNPGHELAPLTEAAVLPLVRARLSGSPSRARRSRTCD